SPEHAHPGSFEQILPRGPVSLSAEFSHTTGSKQQPHAGADLKAAGAHLDGARHAGFRARIKRRRGSRVAHDAADAKMRRERPRPVGADVESNHRSLNTCRERLIEDQRRESRQRVELDAAHEILLNAEDRWSRSDDRADSISDRYCIESLHVNADLLTPQIRD